MDRLDQILHAEERSSNTVESARDQARSLLREARAESELVLETAGREAREAATLARSRVLSDAERDAEALRGAEASKMRSLIEAAESRVDETVSSLVREMVD